MRTTTAARFLAVSLAVLLATMTSSVGRAYQEPKSPPADGPQVAGPQSPPTRPTMPETNTASQTPDAVTQPPAESAGTSPQVPRQYGPAQQTYSSAWPYVGQMPSGRSTHGGTGGSVLASPTGRAGASRYPTSMGLGGGRSSFTSQAAAGAMLGSRTPSSRASVSAKPFSGYSPRPSVSPYMNLFRGDNDYGRVDNYSTLVRPKLQQQQQNRQTQWTFARSGRTPPTRERNCGN